MDFIKTIFIRRRKSIIQPAVDDDLATLSEIHETSFSRGWSESEFEALLAQDVYFCLVARKPGKIEKPPAGFVLVKTVVDEAEIISVATKPTARKRGVARQLMEAAIRHLSAERVKTVFLEVDINNKAAIDLYRKLGFEKISSRESYYSPSNAEGNKPSTALVMQLELG